MKWQDAYDARPSKNSRGEDVFDIYRKDTEDAIWVDILPDNLEEFMRGLLGISERAAEEEFDKLFEEDYTEYKGLGNLGKGEPES